METSGGISTKRKSNFSIIILVVACVLVLGSASYAGAAYYQSKTLVEAGDQLLNSGNYSDALAKYNQAKSKWKWNGKTKAKVADANTLVDEESNYRQGEAAFGNGEWAKCLENFNKVTSKHSKFSSAQQRYSDCQKKSQEAADALKAEADTKAKLEADALAAVQAKAAAAAAQKAADEAANQIPTPVEVTISAFESTSNRPLQLLTANISQVWAGYYEFGVPQEYFHLTYPAVNGGVSARGIIEQGASDIEDLGNLHYRYNKIGNNAIIRVEILNAKQQIVATGKAKILQGR